MELIDVSNVNGHVDFKAVRKTGVTGVWLKATEGTTFDDPLYAGSRAAALTAGLRVGAYHFARPDNNKAETEADHFCRIIGKPGRRDLRPVLDLEKQTTMTPKLLEAWARAFNQRVARNVGVLPAFYSYPAYIANLRLSSPIGNGLWLAAYGPNDGRRHPVTGLTPWHHLIAHQYTSRGVVAGVKGNVDRSYAARLSGVLAHPVLGLL